MQHCCGKRYCFAFISVTKFPWYFDASFKDRKRQDLGLKTCFKYMPNGKEPSAKCLLAFVEVKTTEVVTQRCSVKKVLLKILQNSQENTCTRVSFLIKLQA